MLRSWASDDIVNDRPTELIVKYNKSRIKSDVVENKPYVETQMSIGLEDEDGRPTRVSGETIVAVGLAVTSRGVRSTSEYASMEMFRIFLPSFCKTASVGFTYTFYLAYDKTDEMFKLDKFRSSFSQTYTNITTKLCNPRSIVTASVRFIECQYSGKPAWSQNDALRDAYLEDSQYYYRVNDDTQFTTVGWTEKYIAVLNSFDPPNVGVVGPTHLNGNTNIMTYDFVHQTHLYLFGFYYPRMFVDWSADHWITNVYKPERSTKLADVHVTHVMSLGTRYTHHAVLNEHRQLRLNKDRVIVER